MTNHPFVRRTSFIQLLLRFGLREDAEREAQALLRATASPCESRGAVLDGLASLILYYNWSEFRTTAMNCVDEAIRLEPEVITHRGTKGALLVEEGRYEEGLALLQEVMIGTALENDRAISSYYIALARWRPGDENSARQLLAEAVQKFPQCLVRGRLERLISGDATGSPEVNAASARAT